MKNKILWILTAALGLFLVAQQIQAGEGIDVREAQQLSQQGVLLLDVREAEEFAAGHAPKARLMPLSEIGYRMKELDAWKDKPIAVMCRSGRRSARAVAMLQDAGFKQVSNVQGGILAWEQAGLQVVR